MLGLPVWGIGPTVGIFGNVADPVASTLAGNFTDSVSRTLLAGTGSLDVGTFINRVAVGTAKDLAFSQLNQTGLPLALGVATQTAAFTSDVYGAFRDVLTPPVPVYVRPPVTPEQVSNIDPETGKDTGSSDVQLTGHIHRNPYVQPRRLPPVGPRPMRLPEIDDAEDIEYKSRYDWINGPSIEELPLQFSDLPDLAEEDIRFSEEFYSNVKGAFDGAAFYGPDRDPKTGAWLYRGDGPGSVGKSRDWSYLDAIVDTVKPRYIAPGVGIGSGGVHLLANMFAGSVKDTVSVYDNTSHYESAWLRTYVVGGTTIANTVGVRSLSDAFSEHDTIDAHVQSVGERLFDGLTGGFGVVTAALPISAAATNAFRTAFGSSVVAPVSGVSSFVNESSRATHGYGVNWFRSSRIRSLMGSTEEGRAVLIAAESGRINLTFEAGMNVPKRLYGEMAEGIAGSPNEAMVYLRRTQNGRRFDLLGRSVDGYSHSAATGIHEGLHALGISGSARAEALVRLAELKMHGISINRTAMRQVLQDMRASDTYSSHIVRPDGSLGRTIWREGWTHGLGSTEFGVVY